MHFAKFWAQGNSGPFKCWRSSDVSVADAKAKADESAKVIGERIREGVRWKYGYPDRAVREEVLRQSAGADGALDWAVTRNAYGCDVLNTARAVFVDVDHDGPNLQRHLDAAKRWTEAHPGWSFRAYRTKAGLRLLATHALIAPEDPLIVSGLFPALGTDALYARLCKVQRSYRARLTPKPWRCGMNAPRERWPWPSPSVESRFRSWQARYEEASQRYATCELVGEIGPRNVVAGLAPIVELHDRVTRVGSGLPLA